MTKHIFYVNGKFVSEDQASLPANDLGIVRGYGVFDVLRTYQRIPFKLIEHVERLKSSAASLQIDTPWSVEELEALANDTLKRNYEAMPELGDVTIRFVVTGGPSDNCFTPHQTPSLMIMIAPVASKDALLYETGARVISVSLDRFMPTVKSLNYIGAILAMKEATQSGAVEAIYQTADGLVTEGTRTSFFVVRNNQLLTAQSAVLNGITRNIVMELAATLMPVLQQDVRYDELSSVDEAILVGTTKEVLPIVQVDDIVIGDGRPGPVTRQLMALFDAHVAAVTAPAVSV